MRKHSLIKLSKAPKLGGGQGKKAPSIISKALGVSPDLPVHQQAVSKLLSHPDTNVVQAAQKLLKRF